MAPGERLPKAARKDWNHSLPKFCFAAQLRIKIFKTTGNPKMERPLPRAEQTTVQAMILCSKAWERVLILVGSPRLPSNLVLNPWLLSFFPVKKKKKEQSKKKKNSLGYILFSQWLCYLNGIKLNLTNCVVFFILH